MSDGKLTDYGFVWGPMTVTRLMHDNGRRGGYMVSICTEHHELQVWVSKGGKSMRPFLTKRRADSAGASRPESE